MASFFTNSCFVVRWKDRNAGVGCELERHGERNGDHVMMGIVIRYIVVWTE